MLLIENMKKEKRWTLLRHSGDPKDLKGIHFDLLLEEEDVCRTWRLIEMPVLNGPEVQATIAPIHQLKWLEIEKAKISGDRGWAERINSGFYKGDLPRLIELPFCIQLHSEQLIAWLKMENGFCRIQSCFEKVFDS
tara:strand:+ start:574 stop:981 length:408 start_codon:yes stop_codon:yes gene_type:complete